MPDSATPTAMAPRRLLAILGVGFGIAVTIGNTIGAGILRTPGEIAEHLPSVVPYLAVWVIGGLYALLGANALAELATLVPRSGGQYVFVREALGDYAGFIVGWSDWLSTCGTTALVAITIGEYALIYLPAMRAFEVIALLTIGLLTCVQWLGVRWGGTAQNITSVMKAVVLIGLIIACFRLGGRPPFHDSFLTESDTSFFAAFMLSLTAVIYTYDGWTGVIYFSEEVRNPGRAIPRAMFGGVGLVIAIYLLINVAFLRVVPIGSIAGQKLAAAVVAQHIFGAYADPILRSLFIISLLSAVNSNVLMAPRVLFAMSSDGLFWRGAREVNEGGTPDIALMISSIIAAIFVLTGTFETVIAKLSFFFVANYTLSFASLFVMRRKRPMGGQAPSPIDRAQAGAPVPPLVYRAWGHPFTTGLALLASIAFLIGAMWSDPRNSIYTVILLALSYPIYKVMRR